MKKSIPLNEEALSRHRTWVLDLLKGNHHLHPAKTETSWLINIMKLILVMENLYLCLQIKQQQNLTSNLHQSWCRQRVSIGEHFSIGHLVRLAKVVSEEVYLHFVQAPSVVVSYLYLLFWNSMDGFLVLVSFFLVLQEHAGVTESSQDLPANTDAWTYQH